MLSHAFAVIVAVPAATAVTTPSATVATVGSELSHVTVLSVAFSGVTVAVSVFVSPPTVSSREVLSSATPVTSTVSCVSVIVCACATVTVQLSLASPAVAVITASPTATAVTVPSVTVAIVKENEF